MTINRDNLVDKIRALMAKTVDNGCTEFEALAALDKAKAMMDAYEIDEKELQLTKEESAILRKEPPGSRDPHHIKSGLGVAIAKFTDCKAWRGPDGMVFCGLPSDVRFASWLLDSLSGFVQTELAKHLMGSLAPKGQRRLIINGFVGGCVSRISRRMTDLCQQTAQAVTSNGRELMVIKSTAIADRMKADGIVLGKSRGSSRRCDPEAYRAGQSAGDRASFGRPISGSNSTLRLGN